MLSRAEIRGAASHQTQEVMRQQGMYRVGRTQIRRYITYSTILTMRTADISILCGTSLVSAKLLIKILILER